MAVYLDLLSKNLSINNKIVLGKLSSFSFIQLLTENLRKGQTGERSSQSQASTGLRTHLLRTCPVEVHSKLPIHWIITRLERRPRNARTFCYTFQLSFAFSTLMNCCFNRAFSLAISLQRCIPQVPFLQFFTIASFSGALGPRGFSVIGSAFGQCFLVTIES